MKKYTQSSIYGTSENKNDLLIFVVHGEFRIETIKHFKNLVGDEACPYSLEQLYNYCMVDADIGTKSLAHNVAQILSEKNPDWCIEVFEILIPRNLIDLNRYPETAVHEFFDTIKYPEKKIQMLEIYDEVSLEIEEKLQKSKFSFLPHSMSSYNLSDTTSNSGVKTPKDIEALRKIYHGSIRPFSIFQKNDDAEIISNQEFNKDLKARLESTGYNVDYDNPYHIVGYSPIAEYAEKYNLGIVDIPKYLIATEETCQSYDPTEPLEDAQKIFNLAKIISESLEFRLK